MEENKKIPDSIKITLIICGTIFLIWLIQYVCRLVLAANLYKDALIPYIENM